jgi:hypothetical protein
MAKKIEIELDVKGNIVESTKNLKAMKMELKGLDVGTAEFKKLYNQIDDLEDKIKAGKNVSKDWIDTLEGAGGPIGMLGAGLNKVKVATQSFGGALKATGIGLIVGLIGGLVAAFSQTEGSMKKLEPLMIAMEQIFGGIMEALQPLIDGFIELAIQVMPYVTKAFKVVYSAVTAVFQSLGKLGNAVVKLFKGDFAGAWEDAKSSVTAFSDNYDDAVERFDKGAKKMTKTQKENAKSAAEIAQKALDEKLKRMEAEDKLDEAKLEKMKAEALALAVTEQQKLDVEKAFAQKTYELKAKELDDKMALYKKDSNEYKALLADKTKLDAEYVNTTTDLKDKQIELTKKANKDLMDEEISAINLKKAKGELTEQQYQEALYQTKKKYVSDKKELIDIEVTHEQYLTDQKKKQADLQRAIIFQGLQDQIEALDKKNTELEYDFAADIQRMQDKKALLQQQRDLEIEAVKDDEQKKLEIKKKYGDQINAVEKSITDTQKAEQAARVALALAIADNFAQLGNFMQQIAGKNKGMAKAGLIIEQAAGVAKIVINTLAAASKAGWITPAAIAIEVAGALGVAQAVVATMKGIQQIDAQDATPGGGASAAPSPNSTASLGRNYGDGGMINGPRHAGGGVMINAEGGEAVMTRGAVTMFGPLLSALNQSGGGVAFGNSMVSSYDAPARTNPAAEQQPMIMKTYVVSNELTTAAEKQARLKDLSTL